MVKPFALLLALALAVATGAGCATTSECVRHGGRPWLEYTSPNFTVRSDASPEVARSLVRQLEQARRAMIVLWAKKDPGGRVEVVLLRNKAAYEEFAPSIYGGHFSWAPGGRRPFRLGRPLIVLPGQAYLDDGSPVGQTVYHELAHYFSSYAMWRQPRWVGEGLSEYLETLALDDVGYAIRVRMGRPPDAHLRWLEENEPLSLSELWAWSHDGELRPEEISVRYASSWAWLHFLLTRHERELKQFFADLGQAKDPKVAWAANFGHLSDEQLNRGLREHLGDPRMRMLTRFIRWKPPQVQERELTPAEVHFTRAQLHVNKPGASELAQAELAAALALEPDGREARLDGLGRLATQAERIEAGRALTSQHPDFSPGWLALARALGKGSGSAGERRSALRNAVAADPRDPASQNALSWDLLLSSEPTEALAIAQSAVAEAPWSPAILDTWAAALAMSGRCEEAVSVQRRAVELTAEKRNPEQHNRMARVLRAWEAGCTDPRGTITRPEE